MYFIEGLLCGLKQLNPKGGWLPHDPVRGWEIETPALNEEHCKILLQDDLTFVDGKVVELEKYIEHYKKDIDKIIFHTWHKSLYKLYPNLKFVYYPFFLLDHQKDARKHQKTVEEKFFFDRKKNTFLCLNARKRPHRDKVFAKIKNFKNCIYSYTHRGVPSPMHGDWTMEQYRDWNVNNKDMLTNTKNLLVCADMYNLTQFSIVTETRYNLPCDFITEKTTQCWLALHPALYVSNRYHVAHLRDWGFDLFDDIFDHSYDSKSDSDRIDTLFKNNQSQMQNGIILSDSIKQRLFRNREHYLKNFDKILLSQIKPLNFNTFI